MLRCVLCCYLQHAFLHLYLLSYLEEFLISTSIEIYPKIPLVFYSRSWVSCQSHSHSTVCGCLCNRPPRLLLCPPAGEGNAEDAWLQRRENVNTDHRTVHGRPSAGAVETAGHHHDRQVQTALGWTRWEGKTSPPPTHTHTQKLWAADTGIAIKHTNTYFYLHNLSLNVRNGNTHTTHTSCSKWKFGSSASLWIRRRLILQTGPHQTSEYCDLCNVFNHFSLSVQLIWQSAARRAVIRFDVVCAFDRCTAPTVKRTSQN